ncbi:MAG: ribonuclease P protein component [candidate division WOR-3 bacterium]
MSDQKLPKGEILRGRKLIKWAFENSKTVYRDDFLVLRFCPYGEKRVLFAVERGVRKAVKRNRIKRLLREYYRKNKERFATGIWIFIGKAKLLELKSYQIIIPTNSISPL